MRRRINGWAILSTVFVVLILLPNIDIITHLFMEPNETWLHIKEYLLDDYIKTTLIVVLSTVVLTGVLGTTLAWLISAYDFPLRNFFKWALILPLAIPPYIAAYTYAGMMSYTGSIQVFFREILGLTVDQRFFDIMSIPGAIFIFTMFLFPYVYMITRSFLAKQSAALIENARLLGSNSFEIFTRVILPISRGVIVAGVTLVALEVLSDYGVVSYFGVQTFSTAIFKSWMSLDDIDSAIRLAAMLMVVIFSIIMVERYLRGRKNYAFTNTKVRPIKRKRLVGVTKILAVTYSGSILALGFVIPVAQMMYWALKSYKNIYYADIFTMISNSVWLAAVSSAIIVAIGLVIANYARMKNNVLTKLYTKITLLGYSIPGTVIAITMILFFVDLDHLLAPLYRVMNPDGPKLLLSTSVVMLIFAYVVRFMSIGFENIQGGFDKVGKKFTEASRMLGHSATKTFFKVDLPMIKPAILGAFALTFVDIIKELPLVLTLRPFNFNTLSTKVFEYANDEMIPESAIPSLLIIGVTFIAIVMIYKVLEKEDD